MEDRILSVLEYLMNFKPKGFLQSLLPFFISIASLVFLIVLKVLLGKLIERCFPTFFNREIPDKEELPTDSKFKRKIKSAWGILKKRVARKYREGLWHFAWFFIIFVCGCMGMFISFSILDNADIPPPTPNNGEASTLSGTNISETLNLLTKRVAVSFTTIGYLFVFQWLLRGPLKDHMGKENIIDIGDANRELLTKVWNTIWFVIILIFGIIGLSGSFKTLGVSVAVGAGVLGISFQTPLKAIAGWLMLTVWKPFVEGDYIKIGDIKGEVDQITLMSVILKNTDEADSGTAYIPNATLFDQSVINYTNLSFEGEVSKENGGK